ncbi:glutathione synthase/RimK-type ligase-like ATP-grasp enzyme [Sphingomonas jejuensis]|uniref:Glutathione synthase/RimK-type ligase-like ATP-grasp enzyme n=1 Tax=Sphingomonas jejuensis TaxID=904715 RepID=A0ABX0XJ47_9SPHN|nr:alpha-L-glutamate ligase [Sphingomonas jejuensis]NJC33265.1 glutathione synthase/RimK-type ligase-like ATP-grasp enzyme [Sphingomonas jejuensis]
MTDLAIFYEHPTWFEPLFAALERRGIAATRLTPAGLAYDPADPTPPARMIVNRISMSSGSRATDTPIFFTASLLDHWSQHARVVNGRPFLLDASKARQLSLLSSLGIDAPATRIVHRPQDVAAAAEAIGFPLIVKANIGGAGAGIVRYDDMGALQDAVADGTLPTSSDGVLLVQDLVSARDGRVIRIETLGGRFLYALSVLSDGGFDLCPADACVATPGRAAVRMEAITPPDALIEAAERIVQAAGIEVGGVEVMIDDRDGTPRFYDINALSNFVAKPLDVLGWDPHDRFVDYLSQVMAEARA